MKKVLFLAVAALAFVACKNNQTEAPAEEAVEVVEEVATVVDSTAAVVDSTAAVVEEAAENIAK